MLTALRRRARRARECPDAGLTLMELVVAMSLSSLIGALALSAFIVMGDASGTTIDRNIGVANARNVIQDWTALLQLADSPTTAGQTADRIASITPTEIVFYADIGNRSGTSARGCPTQVDLALSGKRLVEQRTPFTDAACTQPGTTTTSYPLGDEKTFVSTTGWLFTAYDSSSSPVYTAPFSSVARIDVSFEVATVTDSATQTFTSSAALPKGTS